MTHLHCCHLVPTLVHQEQPIRKKRKRFVSSSQRLKLLLLRISSSPDPWHPVWTSADDRRAMSQHLCNAHMCQSSWQVTEAHTNMPKPQKEHIALPTCRVYGKSSVGLNLRDKRCSQDILSPSLQALLSFLHSVCWSQWLPRQLNNI